MKLNDTVSLLKTMLEQKTPVTPMLWGRHGIGKSSIIAQLAKETGYDLVYVMLSQKEAVDIAGVLYTYEDKSLGKSVTANHLPEWYVKACKKGKTILFFDEFNLGRRETMSASFEIVLARTLANTRLPDDVFIVCAGNPEDDRYDTTSMSEALRDRLMHIQIKPDTNEWLSWAKNNIHNDIVNFITQMPEAGASRDNKDDTFPIELKHSFRSWERVSNIWSLPLPAQIKTECVRGIVGPEMTACFMQSLNSFEKPLSVDDVVYNVQASKDKIGKWYPSRMDLISTSVKNLIDGQKTWADKTNVKTLIAFLECLPNDLLVHFLRETIDTTTIAQAVLETPTLKSSLDKIHNLINKR